MTTPSHLATLDPADLTDRQLLDARGFAVGAAKHEDVTVAAMERAAVGAPYYSNDVFGVTQTKADFMAAAGRAARLRDHYHRISAALGAEIERRGVTEAKIADAGRAAMQQIIDNAQRQKG